MILGFILLFVIAGQDGTQYTLEINRYHTETACVLDGQVIVDSAQEALLSKGITVSCAGLIEHEGVR